MGRPFRDKKIFITSPARRIKGFCLLRAADIRKEAMTYVTQCFW